MCKRGKIASRMDEQESEFGALIKLHSEIKTFKVDNSKEILKKFQSIKKNKFKLTAEEEEGNPRLNLSSTTVCAYALSQYFELWKEAGRDYKSKSEFGNLEEYYSFIIEGLKKYLHGKLDDRYKLEAPDEFSLLNMLSLLKKIQENIKENFEKTQKIAEYCQKEYSGWNDTSTKPESSKKDKYDFSSDNEVVCEIIRLLIKQFKENRFSYGEKPHPFIYYKFLRIIDDWKNELVTCDEDFDFFFTKAKIYDDAKYEMYRQIALYNAEDFSLFDVKRLIYSLLIVKLKDKYSNNLIKDKVLDLIFKEQLKTGLFPIGHVVNTDFVIEDDEIKDKNKRIISANPILSSVECLNDMLTHEELKTDLEKYQKNLNSTYEWIIKRLRKDSFGEPLGWFPEYESAHTPESWVAGHTLVFLKKYCEMLSKLIEKTALKQLRAKKHDELDITWNKLCDSYEVKKCVECMVDKDSGLSNPDYRSVLIFGPPGSGKSRIAKALASKLRWNYVELSPSLFLINGVDYIVPKATEIFKMLVRMKETVIFFDEVDQLVKSREKGNDPSLIWIVTSLLPKFQELHEQNEIKFILATNRIPEVDTAMMRSGRIDAVLPMGAICWKDRLKILRDALDDGNNQIKDKIPQKNGLFDDLLNEDQLKENWQIDALNKDDITRQYLRNFLGRTDFMPYSEIKSLVERLFNKGKGGWNEVEKTHVYKDLFSEEEGASRKHQEGFPLGDYENSEFREFHENLLGEYKDKNYVHLPTEISTETPREKYIEEIEDSIFWKYEKTSRVTTAQR